MRITRRLEFDAGHRIPDHRSQCRHMHGHRYALEITLSGEVIAQAGDGQGEAGGQAGMLIARLHREVLESARRTLPVLENRRFADPQLRD